MTRLLPRCRKVTMRPVRTIWCALSWENVKLETTQEKTFTHVLLLFSLNGVARAFFCRIVHLRFTFLCNGFRSQAALGVWSGEDSSGWDESRTTLLGWFTVMNRLWPNPRPTDSSYCAPHGPTSAN